MGDAFRSTYEVTQTAIEMIQVQKSEKEVLTPTEISKVKEEADRLYSLNAGSGIETYDVLDGSATRLTLERAGIIKMDLKPLCVGVVLM